MPPKKKAGKGKGKKKKGKKKDGEKIPFACARCCSPFLPHHSLLASDELTVEDLYKRASQEVDCLKERLGMHSNGYTKC